jgi:hypothetical protein
VGAHLDGDVAPPLELERRPPEQTGKVEPVELSAKDEAASGPTAGDVEDALIVEKGSSSTRRATTVALRSPKNGTAHELSQHRHELRVPYSDTS